MSNMQLISIPARRRKRRSRKQNPQRGAIVIRETARPPRRKSRRSRRRGRQPGRGRKTGVHPYLMSLLNPEEHLAKIPDISGYQSTTFQEILDGVLTTSADGSAALVVYPTSMTPTGTGIASAPLYAAVKGTGLSANVWTTGTTLGMPASAAVVSNFSLVRAVSGVLDVEFMGTTSNDQGQIVGAPLMRGEACQSTFAGLAGNEFACVGPLRNGLRMLWKPQDLADLQYEAALPGQCTGLAFVQNATNPTPSGNSTESVGTDQPKAALAVIVSGGAFSLPIVRFRWTVNYEAVPETNSIALFELTPSQPNHTALDSAFGFMSQVPWGTVWQKAGGLVDALARETLNSQLPQIGGAVYDGARALSSRALSARSQSRLSYDYPVD